MHDQNRVGMLTGVVDILSIVMSMLVIRVCLLTLLGARGYNYGGHAHNKHSEHYHTSGERAQYCGGHPRCGGHPSAVIIKRSHNDDDDDVWRAYS